MSTTAATNAIHPHAALPPNETCHALAQRLRRETHGEVHFDAASRGRYATDASIYQIMPVGVFVPTTPEDVATASAGRRRARRWSSTTASTCAACWMSTWRAAAPPSNRAWCWTT
jgi:hypothetical protein